MRIEQIEYEADGRQMIGQLALDEYCVGRRPAVLLCHEGPGLDEHVKGRAVRLASLGYVAFALDYHGGGVAIPIGDAMARLGELSADPSRTRGIARAGLDVLLAQPEVDPDRLGAVGYCFGGTMVMELARTGADLKAIVGFHPGLGTVQPDDSRNIRGSVLMCCGADDSIVTAEHRHAFEAEMLAAGVADWRIETYGGVGHSFTNPKVDELGMMPGFAYSASANRRAWRSMLDLLEERLGPVD